MAVSLGAAAVLPSLSLSLLVISASLPSASSQRFDLSQLSLRAAAEAQAGTSGYFNCPEQVQEQTGQSGFQIPRRLYAAPTDIPGTSLDWVAFCPSKYYIMLLTTAFTSSLLVLTRSDTGFPGWREIKQQPYRAKYKAINSVVACFPPFPAFVAGPGTNFQVQAYHFQSLKQNTHFELITGYVYTAPDDMLDSRPGTLMLTDCIELCRRNATCKSANFETGLCVLFGSSAEEYPGES